MQPPSRWSTGLLSCFSDCSVCCAGCWVPCMLYAENGKLLQGLQSNAEYQNYCLDAGLYFVLCFFTGCQCFLGIMRRQEIRRKYGLAESPCHDCLVHCCCHPCALCQENREMKSKVMTGYPGAQAVATPGYTGAPGAVQYPTPPKI